MGELLNIVGLSTGVVLYAMLLATVVRVPKTPALKDLEARLEPSKFVRLSRGTLANIDFIVKVNVMPGGTHEAVLSTGQKLQISRLQSRVLRDRFLRL